MLLHSISLWNDPCGTRWCIWKLFWWSEVTESKIMFNISHLELEWGPLKISTSTYMIGVLDLDIEFFRTKFPHDFPSAWGLCFRELMLTFKRRLGTDSRENHSFFWPLWTFAFSKSYFWYPMVVHFSLVIHIVKTW